MRRETDAKVSLSEVVSIHASVKDATDGGYFCCPGCGVSIHASVKDATKVSNVADGSVVFQSTHL